MVAKVSTIKDKIKKGKKLGFSERARAVNKVLLRKQKLKQTLIKLEEATQKLENNSIELNKKRGSFNIKDIERVKVLDSQNFKLRDQIKLLREALELFVSYDTSFKELQNQKRAGGILNPMGAS